MGRRTSVWFVIMGGGTSVWFVVCMGDGVENRSMSQCMIKQMGGGNYEVR
jgi:hypothetical protein